MIALIERPIDSSALLEQVNSPLAGAVVLFLGTTRELTGERRTRHLDYECYPEMAEKKLAELEGEARRRWKLTDCAIVHRLGRLEIGEASVAVAVSSPHRQAAFEAGKWLIDTLKEVVPIWKRETWADGTTEWVHPGLAAGEPTRQKIPRRGELAAVNTLEPLIDQFGRVHGDLRISVTDRCNIRCFYCMPAENVRFKPRSELLTFEEIERFVRASAALGLRKLRITGGEPLVRHELPELIAQLAQTPGIEEIALTTNGLLLAEQAQALRDAGVARLNISLDTLNPETFQRISRRDGFEKVLEGIAVAQQIGFDKIKLNAVAIKGLSEPDLVPLGRFAREHGLEMRFIEFMPLDADGNWDNNQVLSGEDIRQTLAAEIGPLEPLPVINPSQPARDFHFVDGGGVVGFINPVTQPFCSDCNRLRLTAEGQVRNCLFSTVEWDARAVLRQGGGQRELVQLLRDCVSAKKAGHGINSDEFFKPQRAMFQIGG